MRLHRPLLLGGSTTTRLTTPSRVPSAMVADPLLRYDGPDALHEIRTIVREAIPDVPAA